MKRVFLQRWLAFPPPASSVMNGMGKKKIKRPFSSNNSNSNSNFMRKKQELEEEPRSISIFPADQQEEEKEEEKEYSLDFFTAAKIYFTTPPKPKKFGFDFHLVQFFFACLPSLAVYLVAQYARHDIRTRAAEIDAKKKEYVERVIEEELEQDLEEASIVLNPALEDVKIRLDALEVTVKEIVGDSKKLQSNSSLVVSEDPAPLGGDTSDRSIKQDGKIPISDENDGSKAGAVTQGKVLEKPTSVKEPSDSGSATGPKDETEGKEEAK